MPQDVAYESCLQREDVAKNVMSFQGNQRKLLFVFAENVSSILIGMCSKGLSWNNRFYKRDLEEAFVKTLEEGWSC